MSNRIRSADASTRGLAAPTALPPQPFTTIGAKIHLAYREWSAGSE
ncbi:MULTISPECIES: hypothetical protein [Rhizobium]|uniref:Uncharacterized protein n=1 Tax=Rhizobium esperanzae TaxID=1967781 RepID=A0A7W6UIG8_9HYPH|nr:MULTISPECIES: hypothetical protein [Rhizobium]MBB4437672.1 hypothetical protein [Rhizobium esperanzae]MDH6200769.1 hypothetical protein [Rhizobium leguminosarum]